MHSIFKAGRIALEQYHLKGFRLDTKGDCLTAEVGKTPQNGPPRTEQDLNEGTK